MKLAILHPTTIVNPVTELAADILAGVTSITVKNTVQWVANKYALLGSLGFEQAELTLVGTVTAPQTLAVGATNFPHNADNKVTLFDYNQIKIYRSTTGINGSYSLLSTFNIDVSEDFTTYEDVGAQTTYYYKFSYFNLASSAETDQSDPIAATGFVFYALKTLVDRTLSLFGDTDSQFMSRDEVQDYLNEFYGEAQHELALATKRLSIKTYTFTVSTGVQSYALPTDFLIEKALRASQDGGSTFPYYCTMINVDHLGDVFNTNILYAYSIVGSNIELDPIPTNNTDQIKIYYIATPAMLSLQTDTLSSPFADRSAMFVRFALSMCYLKDKKMDEYEKLRDESRNRLKDFVSYVKRLGNLHPQYAQIADSSLV